LLLIIAGTAGFSFAQETTAAETAEGPVDETSLILFPDETAPQGDETQAVQEQTAPSSVGIGDLIRVIIVLAGVIGIIYLLVYFLRRYSPLAENEEDQIGLLATRHLKKDSSLHLIEVGNQVFLIGSGTNNVSLISEITDKETIDRLHLETTSENTAAAGNSFRSLFTRSFARKDIKGISEQSPDFLRQQRDRLRNLREEE
jgi:flagellar biogenesis protein FliO